MIGDRVYDTFLNEVGTILEDNGIITVEFTKEPVSSIKYKDIDAVDLINIDAVLRTVKDGKRCADLTSLYELPLRDLINWLEFPVALRPNCVTELCHE